jgi:hypothetical protein
VVTRNDLIQKSLDEEKKYQESLKVNNAGSSSNNNNNNDQGNQDDFDGNSAISKKKSGKKSKKDFLEDEIENPPPTKSFLGSSNSIGTGNNNNKLRYGSSLIEKDDAKGGDGDSSKDEDEVDDNCFVCGLDGELLMCDYPDCPRVYHSVCILKVAPKPLMIDTAYDGYDASLQEDDNLWYCPKHFCFVCSALELVPKLQQSTINQAVTLPQNLFLQAKQKQFELRKQKNDFTANNNLFEILNQKKSMRSCRSCPLTVCTECDHCIAPHSSAFKSKRGYGVRITVFPFEISHFFFFSF